MVDNPRLLMFSSYKNRPKLDDFSDVFSPPGMLGQKLATEDLDDFATKEMMRMEAPFYGGAIMVIYHGKQMKNHLKQHIQEKLEPENHADFEKENHHSKPSSWGFSCLD